MVYYDKKNYKLVGFQISKTKNKMYDAIIKSKLNKIHLIPFGDKRFENFQDKTGLNLYPNLIHNDKIRRKNYRNRQMILWVKPSRWFTNCENVFLFILIL